LPQGIASRFVFSSEQVVIPAKYSDQPECCISRLNDGQIVPTIVGRDTCRLGIALSAMTAATARYPDTTEGIAPYNSCDSPALVIVLPGKLNYTGFA
jgi:hypothetical protein